MMTEEDTFRVLSRASFEELRNYWIANSITPIDITLAYIKSKGWTYMEFRNEWYKRKD